MHRFHLTRLQAQAQTLDLAAGQAPSHVRLAQARTEWIDALEHRRAELADRADDRLIALSLPARALPCEHIVQSALDEAGETMAFLEDMSLRRAVDRLSLVGDDLARLAGSCWRWPIEEPRSRGPLEIPGAIFSSPFGPLADGTPDHFHADDREQPDNLESGRLEPDRDDDRTDITINRLREAGAAGQSRQRQVRREWQEKLLALRMETRFGRRAVAILENTVLVLILVLFALMVAEAVLERVRPSGLSAGEHWFFAWADLAVCSVFLFEFTLKLALAPTGRATFFATW